MKLSDVQDDEQTGLVESNQDKPDDVYGSGFGGSKREQTDFSEWTV